MNIKKLTLSVATAAILSTSSFADSSYIGYQGVAFDNGNAVADTNVSLRFTVYQTNGDNVYQETVSNVTTTDKGYFSHNIGSGTETGLIETVPWSNVNWSDDYKIKVEIDTANGNSYTDLGTKNLVSVPYAKGIDGVSATATEINKLDGVTATTTELNYLEGVSSGIQSQLNSKLSTTGGTILNGLTINAALIVNENGGAFDFRVEGDTNENMLFADASEDRIGIGTNIPDYPLHVGIEEGSAPSTDVYFKNQDGTPATGSLSSISGEKVSIYSVGAVRAEIFFAHSDKRIKIDIKDVDNSIEKLMQVRPTVYKKKDITHGNRDQYGFIAQELETVIPEAVSTGKGEVPILKPFEEVTIEEGVEYTILVKNGSDIKEQTFKKGDTRPDGEIIVKSKKVDDFRTVNYDMVFTVAVDAIQEQQEIIETQKEKIQTLESKLQAIEKSLKNSGINID